MGPTFYERIFLRKLVSKFTVMIWAQRLAHTEMRSIMVRILWNFDIELCLGSDNWMARKVFVLWDKPPLNVRLFSRFMEAEYEQWEVLLPGSITTQ